MEAARGVPPSEEVDEEWLLRLSFRATKDEQEDWSQMSQALSWLPELSMRERILLGKDLRREGMARLTCQGPEEVCRRLAGIRGDKVQAQVFEPDGTEFLPGGLGTISRRARGVYATPRALTRFVVRSVDGLLRSRLGLDGLCDDRVRLLDPAAGSMNFVLEAYRHALAQERKRAGREGLKPLVDEHLLPHFQGFEILPGSWAEGHQEVRRFLKRIGLASNSAIPLFLADALASPGMRPWSGFLGREAQAVHRLRSETPFNVVLGNPPFNGRSANRGSWIGDLLRGYTLPDGRTDEGYFNLDGRSLGERNVKWLQDDYVKFLRLAQWMIDRNGSGIVAFIVNHNCLEAPTFRGLRQSLLRTFNQIFALDLHGNQRRREKGPDGQRDENVFEGVAQGIAVLFLVKNSSLGKAVYRGDLFGTRKEKLRTLAGSSLEALPWTEMQPRAPLFLFRPSDALREREYQRGIPLPEIFPVHSLGVVTGQDARVLAFNREDFEARLERSGNGLSRRSMTSFLYRPFDVRQLYQGAPLERPRKAVMSHFQRGGNVGLLALRQSTTSTAVLVTRWTAGHKVIDAYAPNTVFPLFLSGEQGTSLPNLALDILRRFAAHLGEIPMPEDLLGYIYAVLHDLRYLSRFGEQLRAGFPRIPLPDGRQEFRRLAALGSELVALHLLADPRLASSSAQLGGDPCRLPAIDARALLYEESAGRVRLNRNGLCFEGIAPDVWRYQVGSYQVLDRWLRARAGGPLTVHALREFRWIAEAIRLSLAVQKRISGGDPPEVKRYPSAWPER